MNKHIELVKKWLADTKSVTEKELLDNKDAAYAANAAAFAAVDADVDAVNAAYYAAYAANAAYGAYYGANAAYVAAYFVKRYEELMEQK